MSWHVFAFQSHSYFIDMYLLVVYVKLEMREIS